MEEIIKQQGLNNAYDLAEHIANRLSKSTGPASYRYIIEDEIERYIREFSKQLRVNYAKGAGFDSDMSFNGIDLMFIGEGDGMIALTGSKIRAAKAMSDFENTHGSDGEIKPEDLKETMIWTYQDPSETDNDHEGFYYDFDSQHPKARKAYYIRF